MRLSGWAVPGFLLAILTAPTFAQGSGGAVEVAQRGPSYEVRYTANFLPDELSLDTVLGYDHVEITDGAWLNEAGLPLLPVRIASVALPAGMTVTGLRVLGVETVDVEGEYTIFPGQPYTRCSLPAPEFTAPNPLAYASADPYPLEVAELIDQADLAGQSFARVRLYPVQYVAAQKKLRLCTAIRIALDGVPGYVCGDYLPQRISEEGRATLEQMLVESVVNPEHIAVQADPAGAPSSRGVAPGDYDYVIITQSSWASAFAPLAAWKTKKGVPATVVTTTWIYTSGGYSGTEAEKIRAFVIDAYNNWGTTFFLLGGDTNTVPYHVDHHIEDDIPNDTYYADFDSDWFTEVNVGRASVRDSAAVATFVNKTLNYEKNPPLTDFAKTATLLGFDLKELHSNEGQLCKYYIHSNYLPATWTVRTEYDSEQGSHKADATGYLNLGNVLVNHIDHSSTNVMGVGSVNHGDYFSTSDMGALTNGSRQSLWYSIGCWACDYAATTCVAEAFVRNASGGGIGFIGNSRYGWYIPYIGDGASLRYDRYFFRSVMSQGHDRMGVALADHRNDAYAGDSYARYIYTELTLLGDPQTRLWLENPGAFTVEHPATLPVNAYTSFPVFVYRNGVPASGFTVCLMKDNDVYEVAMTGAEGYVTFWFAPGTTGTMYVTVTRKNYVPYEGQAQVVYGPTDPEACCFGDESCLDRLAQDCVALGGTPLGPGTACATACCPGPARACCFEDGSCADLDPAVCTGDGGTPWAAGTDCDSVYCPQPPDPRMIDIGLISTVNPNSVCPGRSFDVYVTLSAPDDDIQDLRLLQFDASLSTNLTVNSVTWQLPVLPGMYLFDSYLPVIGAAYTGVEREPGYIVDLDATAQTVARLSVTYQGGTAELNVVGPAGTSIDEGAYFEAGFDPVPSFSLNLGNVTGGTLIFSEGSCDEIHIVSSDPADGWIDARVPIDPSTLEVQGWTSVQVTFDGDVEGLAVTDFAVTEVCASGSCDGVAPSVSALLPISSTTVLLALDRPIDPRAWTVITLLGGDPTDRIRLGYLPADADGSRTSNAQDIVQVINQINAVFGGGTPVLHQCDINRSGTVTVADMLTLINLLNGASPYPVAYFGEQLPALP
ncbi:MAG TPA: C25 family cysteine peptidase [Phycisphaerae bacterium]|nr:C25 family cysteine peptidase [Phycisphaerae bacterium]HNU44226.1 C25 family cysteine peptidase [Phycisphaerae bacterium]